MGAIDRINARIAKAAKDHARRVQADALIVEQAMMMGTEIALGLVMEKFNGAASEMQSVRDYLSKATQ